DAKTRAQIARVSWRANGDEVGLGDDAQAEVFAEAWLDPRQFGVPQAPLAGAWAADNLEWVPLCVLGHEGGNANDYAQAVLTRLLLSTGTGAWSGVGDAATFTVGDNADGTSKKANDAEIAGLGLGIPAALV